MTSGSHLSKELLDLVKSIGESRSKQEEDRIISNEASLLRVKFQERNVPEKKMKELLIRAIYVEMLGHDATFSHIHAVNLAQSKNLLVKRIGYLAASLFIDENSEMIILMISTMQRDLKSHNHLEIVAALNCLAKLSNQSVQLAVTDDITRLLDHNHEIIRKKAVMVLIKFNTISPVDQMDVKMKKALCDKEPSVMACALNYFQDQVKQYPSKYKDLVNHFIIILKQIIDHRLPREFDYHRLPAPWVQTKILEILSYLGENDQETSKTMYEIITTVLKRSDDSAINVGYALVYQCLRTITRIYPSQELLDLATQTISRFLSSSSKNLKYMGIMGLIQIVKIDPKYTLDYQNMVVDCLEDADDTLKIRTLDLLYKMTNKQNVEPIVEKLLSYLKNAPVESSARKDLVVKIHELGEKFAPNKNWYIRTMNKVFEMGGDLITQNLTNQFMSSLIEYQRQEDGEMFRDSTIKIYLKVLKKNPNIPESLMQVIAWIMGEYGPDIPDKEKIDSIIEELCNQTYLGYENPTTVGLIVSALGKLHLAQGFASNPQIERVMRDYADSKHINVQQRCLEYINLKTNFSQINNCSQIMKGTPMNEEQLQLEGLDLELTFLDGFVQQELANGKPAYNQGMCQTGNAVSSVPVSNLNFKAYQPEQPKYNMATPAQSTVVKETTQNNPVFANQINTTNNDQIKLSGGTKQVWGSSAPADPSPASTNVSNPAFSTPASTTANKKPEPPKPVVDEKREQMKNSLFSGISSAKKDDSSDSDDEKKKAAAKAEPVNEINLLDMGNEQPDLLGTATTQPTNPPASTGNLLDDMFDTSTTVQQPPANTGGGLLDTPSQPAPTQQSAFGDILGGFGAASPQPVVQQPTPQYQAVPGFNTGTFGQTWMTLPAEQKANVPCPQSIASNPVPSQPEAYCAKLQQGTGIQKVEIINNEVIAAGSLISNPQVCVLVHTRITPQALDFTVRSAQQDITAKLLQELQVVFSQ